MAKAKIKIAIIGFGNLGKALKYAISANRDMQLAEIITRRPEQVRRLVKKVPVFSMEKFKVLADIAVLCGGSKDDIFGRGHEAHKMRITDARSAGQGLYFAQFFNTVDSFDTHARARAYFDRINYIAQSNRHTSIISAGWDPGTFSLERLYAHAFIPAGKTYTFWGPGVSQGHSDAVRRVNGVKDARAYTLPVSSAKRSARAGRRPRLASNRAHRRKVFVVAQPYVDKERIAAEIKQMPDYFAGYDTQVVFISEKTLERHHRKFPHCGSVIANGTTAGKNKALIEYQCSWASNPEGTANILVACARACCRLNNEKKYGAFTMLEIPPCYYSAHSQKKLLEAYL